MVGGLDGCFALFLLPAGRPIEGKGNCLADKVLYSREIVAGLPIIYLKCRRGWSVVKVAEKYSEKILKKYCKSEYLAAFAK